MSAPSSHATRLAAKVLLAVAVACSGGLAGTAVAGAAETEPTAINTVVLHMSGAITLKLDKGFVKTVKASKATISAKGGATYDAKKRLVTLPVDSSTTVTLSPLSADLISSGTLVVRRKDGRKVAAEDIAIRIRPTASDLSGTLRGIPGKEFAALTVGSDTNVQQTANGYSFVKVPMLVSLDYASAAKKAKLKSLTAGTLMGLMSAEIVADLPTFQLPTLDSLFGSGLGGSVTTPTF